MLDMLLIGDDGDDDDDDDDGDDGDDDDDDGDGDGNGDDRPRKENEDPGKETTTKLVGDAIEKNQGLIRILETTTFQSPSELLKTIKNQTDKQSHPKPNTDPWMEPLEVDQNETFTVADIIQRYTDVIQQEDNTPYLVAAKELEEAVQNICDL